MILTVLVGKDCVGFFVGGGAGNRPSVYLGEKSGGPRESGESRGGRRGEGIAVYRNLDA